MRLLSRPINSPASYHALVAPSTAACGASARGFTAAALLFALSAISAFAQQTQPASAPPTQPAQVSVAEQAERARRWIAAADTDEPIRAFQSAAEIRKRTYSAPAPQRVWIARVDLRAPGVRLQLTEPADFEGEEAKFETRCANTLEFARHTGVQLAFNTSAFGPFRARMGQPMNVAGFAATAGRIYSKPEKDYGALLIDREGRASLRGAARDEGGTWHAIPGFRMLLDDGQIVVSQQEADSGFGGVNPRTAVGVDRDGGTLWIVVADGRQKGVAVGWTLVELAVLMESLGCRDALNLDGGGSSTFVLEDEAGVHRLMNTPVGAGVAGSLRQVAHNVGFYLPGTAIAAAKAAPRDLREAIVRTAVLRPRGGEYSPDQSGVFLDLTYGGRTILPMDPAKVNDVGATLSVMLDAWRLTPGPAPEAPEHWFADMNLDRFEAFVNAWYSEEAFESPEHPLSRLPANDARGVAALCRAGLANPTRDWRDLQRGDIIHFVRPEGTRQTAVFWGADRDDEQRPRIWMWSAFHNPRHAYPLLPGSAPVVTPGISLNWELWGAEIDPSRFYGAVWRDADLAAGRGAATRPATAPTAAADGAPEDAAHGEKQAPATKP
ncbi:MAG: phosphodiester glycosidase family protein [Phycisphaerales bacterium]|nr:phosphodiester glycosidase family protein [Phycisphaerales bacterium]